MSLGGSQKIYIEDTLKDLSLQGSPTSGGDQSKYNSQGQNVNSIQSLNKIPNIVKEIEQMEKDFTEFLE